MSFVLNNTPNQTMPDATRLRVHAAARELGYIPSAAATTLQSGRSRIVLGLLPNLRHSEPVARLTAQLSTHLRSLGLVLLLYPDAQPGTDTFVWAAIEPAVVLALFPLPPPETDWLLTAGFEVVQASEIEDSDRPISQQKIGYLQARHLIDQGHRHLGFAASADPRERIFGEPRLLGVCQACAEAHLPTPTSVGVYPSLDDSAAKLRQLVSPQAITGICAHNDDVALAVLASAREVGIRVPEDLSVIGVDDTAAGRLSLPTLSTIQLATDAAAAALAVHIGHRLHLGIPGHLQEASTVRGPQLIQRQSTNPV